MSKKKKGPGDGKTVKRLRKIDKIRNHTGPLKELNPKSIRSQFGKKGKPGESIKEGLKIHNTSRVGVEQIGKKRRRETKTWGENSS